MSTWFKKAGKAGSILPLRPFLGNVFARENGGYGVAFELGGVDSECLSREELDYISARLMVARKLAASVGCVMYEYLIAQKRDELPGRKIEDEIVAEQTADRVEFLKSTAKFKRFRLVTVIYAEPTAWGAITRSKDSIRKAMSAINRAALLYRRILSSVVAIRQLTADEIVQHFSYLQNLDERLTVKKVAQRAADVRKLAKAPIVWDGESLRIGNRRARMFSLMRLPKGTMPNLWGDLLVTPCEFVLCAIWRPYSNRKIRGKVKSRQEGIGAFGSGVLDAAMSGIGGEIASKTPRASDKLKEKQIDKLGDVLLDIDGSLGYGEFSMFGLVHSWDSAEIAASLVEIHHAFSEPSEAEIVEETDWSSLPAYYAMFPGNTSSNVRRPTMRSDHAANLGLIYKPFEGHAWSADLNDEYTYIFETRQRSPFFWTPFDETGLGGWFVNGAPGHGKSVVVNSLVAADQKHKGFTFIFDRRLSYEYTVKTLGGAVVELGLSGPRVNPFRLPDTKENRHFISMFVRLLIEKSGLAMQAEDVDCIESAVGRAYENLPQELRQLKTFALLLPDALRYRLKRWIEGGVYGAIFDNLEDELDIKSKRLQLFVFGALGSQHEDLIEANLFWLLWRIKNVVRDAEHVGVQKHIVMEELWKQMENKNLLDFVLGALKENRQDLARVTLVTHLVKDLGQYADTIRNACPNSLFLGGPFNRDEYRKFFSLNETQLDNLADLQDREMMVVTDSYSKILKLNLDPKAYARVTTRNQEKREREELIGQFGTDEGLARFAKAMAAKHEGN